MSKNENRSRSKDFSQNLDLRWGQHHFNYLYTNLHKTIQSDNSQSIQDVCNLFSLSELNQDYPVPLLPPNNITNKVLNGEDFIKNLIQDKNIWMKRKHYLVLNQNKQYRKNKSYKRRIDECINIGDLDKADFVTIPLELWKVANHIEKDPDPHFTGDENWYYGNSLVACELREQAYVISARGPFMNELYITPLVLNEDRQSWKAKYKQSDIIIPLHNHQPILEIKTSNQYYIATRNKTSIQVIHKHPDDGTQHEVTTPIFNISSSTCPYTSIDLFKNELVVSNTNRKVNLYDVESKESIFKLKVKNKIECNLVNKWNSISFCGSSHPDVLTFSDTCSINTIDTRVSPDDNPYNSWCLKNVLDTCERISVVQESLYNPHIKYICTNHYMFCFDKRMIKNNNFISRCSHHLGTPPLICANRLIDRNETIILGDQICNERRCIEIDWSKGTHFISSYPKSVNTPLNTLYQAQIQGQCLSIPTIARFETKLRGMSFLNIESNKGYTLFSQTSSGDVFYQNVKQDKFTKPDNELERKLQMLSISELSHRNLKQSECFVLKNWCKKYKKEDLAQRKVVSTYSNEPSKMINLFNRSTPSYERESNTQSVNENDITDDQGLSDLAGCGIDISVLKLTDDIMPSITNWSDDDDSSDDERPILDVTNPISDANESVQVETNINIELEDISAGNTLKEVYVLTDEEDPGSTRILTTSESSWYEEEDEYIPVRSNIKVNLKTIRKTKSTRKTINTPELTHENYDTPKSPRRAKILTQSTFSNENCETPKSSRKRKKVTSQFINENSDTS